MKLYGNDFSPYVRHCRIALAECEIPYEFIKVDHAQSARQSPTARMPFLEDGELRLNDSASILRHIRNQVGQPFMPDIEDYELFLLTNTGMDTSINLFLLEKDGLGPENVPYLARQAARVESVLTELDTRCGMLQDPIQPPFTDGLLRVGCYLRWALFRERLSIDAHAHLQRLLQVMEEWPLLAETDPRRVA
ncbi:MAG: glutathione S-transferase [Pseudomonadota bacterium]